MVGIGWVEVVFARNEFEDDRVLLGLEERRGAEVGGDERRAMF